MTHVNKARSRRRGNKCYMPIAGMRLALVGAAFKETSSARLTGAAFSQSTLQLLLSISLLLRMCSSVYRRCTAAAPDSLPA